MNREDIIRMAREAGIKLPDGAFPERGSFALPELLELARLSYAAGAAAKSEWLANTIERQARAMSDHFEVKWLRELAAAIRARGQS
jgi:hypothetical protein